MWVNHHHMFGFIHRGGGRLLAENLNLKAVHAITQRYSWGPISYAAALALVFVSIEASLALQLGMAVFFGLTRPGH